MTVIFGMTVTFHQIGATILFIEDGKVIDRWGAFSFYDILTDLGLVPPLWELHGKLEREP